MWCLIFVEKQNVILFTILYIENRRKAALFAKRVRKRPYACKLSLHSYADLKENTVGYGGSLFSLTDGTVFWLTSGHILFSLA